MDRLEPVTLIGRQVRLEPLSLAHLEALGAVVLEPALWEWTISRVTTEGELDRYIRTALAWGEEGHALAFATIETGGGTVVGTTRFGNFDPEHRRVEIGWTTVASAWQRTAINTEAKLLMLTHGFETLHLNRVELKTDALNLRSRTAIQRLGAREEGVLRSHAITSTGRVRDTVYYSIVAPEWPAVRARLEGLLAR